MEQLKGTLPVGLKFGDETLKAFVMRPATAGDLFAAEEEAPVGRQLAFQAALAGQQLVSLGSQSGPFGLELLRKLDPKDLDELIAAQTKLDDAGKNEPSS